MKKHLLLALSFLLLVIIPHTTHAAGTTVTVNSAATLASAIKAATPGETIMLAYGTYTRPLFSNLNFSSPVTITSADPSHQAIIAGLAVSSSTNLVFKGLEFSTVGSPDAYYAFRITTASNVTFTDLDVRGNLSIAPGSELNGFLVEHSNGVTISNSQFQYLNSAITVGEDTNVTISNNTINFVSKGGVEMGGSSFVKITDNKFSNFITSAGTHGDVIQLFTDDTTSAGHRHYDYLVTCSLADPVSLPKESLSKTSLVHSRYYNMVIDNNAMLGGDWNSIYLEHATGNIEVDNNITASWLGANVVTGGNTNFIGWIFLRGDYTGAHVTETGNRSQAYLVGTTTLAKPPAGNTLIGQVTDNGAALIASLTATTPVNVGTASTTPPVSTTSPSTPTGTSSGTSTTSSTAASIKPVVTMSFTPSRMVHGGTATITWSSTNAVSCVGTNEDYLQSAWNSKLPTSGTFVESNMQNGQHFFLTCINASGKGGSSYIWVGVPIAPATTTATTTKSSLTASVYDSLSGALYGLTKFFMGL